MAAPAGPASTDQPVAPESAIADFLAKSDPDFKPDAEDTPSGEEEEPAKAAGEEEEPEKGKGEEEEEEEEQKAKGEGEEEDEDVIETLSDLAELFKIDEGELTEQLVVEGANGSKVPLKQALEEWHKGSDPVASSQAVQERLAEINHERDELVQNFEGKQKLLSEMTEALIVQIEGEPVNWRELKETDPEKYIAEADRVSAQRGMVQRIIGELRKIEAEGHEKAQKAFDEWKAEQPKILAEAVPEWRDKEAAKKAGDEMTAWLHARGFSDEETNELADARYILIVRDAMTLDKLRKSKPEVTKRVKRAPKRGLRVSAREGEGAGEARKQRARRRRLGQTGSIHDAAAALEVMV